MLLDQAEAAGRTRISIGVAADLVGHGVEERLEHLLRWWPSGRQQVAAAALVVAAGLSLLMLAGEVIGAHYRPPAAEVSDYSVYFLSGPFLSIGVGLYGVLLAAALAALLGHGGVARLLALLSVAGAGWMLSAGWSRWQLGAGGYPVPRPMVLVLLGLLALLATLATVRVTPRTARRLTGWGGGFLVALVLGIALTKPWLGWSVGTMTTSGLVALANLATVLPFVAGLALLVAAVRSRSHPGWPSALAAVAFPVVLFCTAVSVAVNPLQAGTRTLIPFAYLAVVLLVALASRRVRRRALAG